MRKALSVLLQFALFLALFLGGSLLAPFGLAWAVTHPTPTSTRSFTPDGLLLMIGFFLLILVIELILKKLRAMGTWSTLAFLLALVLGWLGHFGMATHDLL